VDNLFFFEKKYVDDTLHVEADDVLIASPYFNHHGGGLKIELIFFLSKKPNF
jgi:hypothetical protein